MKYYYGSYIKYYYGSSKFIYWRKLVNVSGRIEKAVIPRNIHQRGALEKEENSTV